MARMDSIVLARLAPAWADDLVGANFAGVRKADAGCELVFDRAPDGARPGRRSALWVRLAAPVWAWTGPAAAADAPGAWAYRPPGAPVLDTLQAEPGDRRIVLDLGVVRVHLELWPPGNVLVEDADGRLAWCARSRPASSFRPVIAAGREYSPPQAPAVRDPLLMDDATLAAWFVAGPADTGERLARMARDFAGLPKALMEVLAPTLPRRVLVAGALSVSDAAALAAEFRAWARATYAGEPPVRAYAWTWPSPGATLMTRALVVAAPAPGAGAGAAAPGLRFVGSYGGWSEAARETARALPVPIDGERIAAAKAQLRRLERAHAAVEADIAAARGAGEVRADATALAAFLPRVERGATEATVPDPVDPARTRTVALDPRQKPHENVDRLFKRAGKLERVAAQAPARLAELDAQIVRARAELAAAERGEAPAPGGRATRRGATGFADDASGAAGPGGAARKKAAVPSVLVPRKFKSREGWEVWIGKNNAGNDHLTHRLARSEDVWMHVHGAAGSHVVLRRGRGPNEPSKATLEEVAGWAAFYSQARNAGTVPVTVTQKKYVSKPRKAPAGLAHVTRSKTVFARPAEPPDEARVDDAGDA
jgi:predicted ribosome quality control (RQC) complex YloA/Tae2 family protein